MDGQRWIEDARRQRMRRTVVLDVSALGGFTSASQLNIGATADLTYGPQPSPITVAPKLTVTLAGYGVSFLLLKP